MEDNRGKQAKKMTRSQVRKYVMSQIKKGYKISYPKNQQYINDLIDIIYKYKLNGHS